jgi:hypothetical protein
MHRHDWAPCDFYPVYRDATEEADAALAAWYTAPPAARGEAYTVYRAAADREDAAALAWLEACREYDAARTAVA